MRWLATVWYTDKGGNLQKKTKHYPVVQKSDGSAVELDRTRVIRDVVPEGCTTTRITRKQVP